MARSRIVRTPEQIASILAHLDASELTVAAFCRETGLSSSTLRLWLRKRSIAPAPERDRPTPSLQRVEVIPSSQSPASSPPAPLELAFPCGTVLRLHGVADPAQLELTIAAVLACSA